MAHPVLLRRSFNCSALVLIALAAYFQASGANRLLAASLASSPEPVSPTRRSVAARVESHASSAAILARNVFDSITGPLRRPEVGNIPPLSGHDVDPLLAPTCDAQSVVIISESPDPRWSVAALRSADQPRVELHRIGDDMAGQRVEFIGYNPLQRSPAVWLSSAGNLCQALLFSQLTAPTTNTVESGAPGSGVARTTAETSVPRTIAAKIRKLSDTEYVIERSALEQIMDSQSELMRSVRIVPETKDGQVRGVRVFGIRPGSLPTLLGLQNADLLLSINGFDIASPESALQSYAQLARATALDVRLERHGAPVALWIRIQ